MAILKLYADGSHNSTTNKAGWAYILVHCDSVILAECGLVDGDSTDGENLAVINGLLSVPSGTRVKVITDREDIARAMDDKKFCEDTSKKKLRSCRLVLNKLGESDNAIVEVIRSGRHHRHRQVDTMSRFACGLRSKNYVKRQSRKRSKKKLYKINNMKSLKTTVLYKCHNRKCINPDHVYVGS